MQLVKTLQIAAIVSIVSGSLLPGSVRAGEVEKIPSKEELKARLTPLQYEVTQENGEEGKRGQKGGEGGGGMSGKDESGTEESL